MAKHKAEQVEEELAKMEAELAAQVSEEVEEPDQDQSVEEETIEEDSPPTEEPQQEETPEEEKSESEEAEAGTPEEEVESEDLSEKAQRRFKELAEARKKLLEENEQLKAELDKKQKRDELFRPIEEVLKDEPQEEESKLPWRQEIATKAEVVETVQEAMARERQRANVSRDVVWAEETYPELNPDHKDYDEDITKGIYDDYVRVYKSDPSISLKDMVDRRMKPIYKAREKALKEAEEKLKLKKQNAEQAPPTNVAPPKKERTLEDMVREASSMEELERLERRIGVSDR